MTTATSDVVIKNEGTILVFNTYSEAAQQWVEENVDITPGMGEPARFYTDWRMGEAIAVGMSNEGFVMEFA